MSGKTNYPDYSLGGKGVKYIWNDWVLEVADNQATAWTCHFTRPCRGSADTRLNDIHPTYIGGLGPSCIKGNATRKVVLEWKDVRCPGCKDWWYRNVAGSLTPGDISLKNAFRVTKEHQDPEEIPEWLQ